MSQCEFVFHIVSHLTHLTLSLCMVLRLSLDMGYQLLPLSQDLTVSGVPVLKILSGHLGAVDEILLNDALRSFLWRPLSLVAHVRLTSPSGLLQTQ